MAETRSSENRYRARRTRKNNKKKHNAAIWLVLAAIFIGGAVYFASCFHEDKKEDVRKTAYPQKYKEYVDKAAADYRLDDSLIYAVIHTESGFNTYAESAVGARGLMQIMPESFDWLMSLRNESGQYTYDDLYTPSVCIDYGCYLLRYNLDLFDQDEICAVAAYNAGMGKVQEWLSDPNLSSDGKTFDDPSNIPIEETRNYVKKVESAKKKYEEIYN